MKVRVLHCLETIGTGGVEQRRLSMARYFDPNAFEQRVVCSYVVGGFDEKLRKLGTQVVAIRGLYHIFNVGYYYRLFRVICEFRPHIIHGAVFEGVVSAVLGGLLFRIPVIIIEETSFPKRRSWRANLLMRFFSSAADFVVGTSPAVVEYLGSIGVKEDKRRLINNGVETPPDQSAEDVALMEKKLGIESTNLVVGCVGRLNVVKRFDDVIRAVASLNDKRVKLLIVGDGPDRQRLTELTNSLGVSNQVIFTGYQEPWIYYSCMDCFALCSESEGFGMVVVEAMLYRLPVVATAVGGMREIVLDGETGYLVNVEAPESIANALSKLISDSTLRMRMGQAGLQRAKKYYSAENYSGLVADLYHEALHKAGIQQNKTSY